MNSTTNITHLGAAIIPTKDVDAAIAYYTEKLGFEKRMDVPYGEGDRWVEVAPAGAQTSIALAPPPPDGSPVGEVRNLGFATKDIDAAHAELKERGADVDDAVTRFGDPVPPLFWFRDPEGNSLMVVQRDD
jgi:predicted enzyme related to lactoylglutathione lyase